MPAPVDITGQTYGRLTAIGQTDKRDSVGSVVWMCECSCGAMHQASSRMLRSGQVRSCGCAHDEYCQSGAARRRHAKARTPIYAIWNSMKQRCLNPSSHAYADYGGRGIKVCDRWMTFDNFYADMGDRPGDLTLDRINNDGDYEPGNVRWATRSQQAFNRRPKAAYRSRLAISTLTN